MVEQFKGTVESKSIVGFLVNVYLFFSGKIHVFETMVKKCLLVPHQEVAVFKEGQQVSIITPTCGDCPAAVNNGADGSPGKEICHIYRSNLPYL